MEYKSVMLSRGRLSYYESGSGDRLILFFHGAFAVTDAYLPLLTLLGKHFRIIAPNLPGHGSSFVFGDDWTVGDFTATCREFIDQLGIRPDFLIGHSFGGVVALSVADINPAATVIVMDGAGLPVAVSPRKYLGGLFRETAGSLIHRYPSGLIRRTLQGSAILATMLIRHFPEVRWFAREVPHINRSEDYRHTRNPVILLWGEADTVAPLTLGREMVRILPNARLVTLSGRGHVYCVIDPVFTAAKLIEVIG